MLNETFKRRFEALTGYKPFPWQIELFEKWFVKGSFPSHAIYPQDWARHPLSRFGSSL